MKYQSKIFGQRYTGVINGVESNCYAMLFENDGISDVYIYTGQQKTPRTLAPGESVIYGGGNPEITETTVFNISAESTLYVERTFLTKAGC